jgi:hypothetical protein
MTSAAMNAPSRPTFRRIDSGDSTVFRLPRRRLGRLAWAGLLPIGFSCLFSGFAVFWMVGASQAINMNGQFSWFGVAFTAFGLPFFFVGLIPAFFGLSTMVGRNDIALADGEIRCVERVGPFRWTRKRSVDSIRALNVATSTGKTSSLFGELGALVAPGPARRSFIIAWGYPRAMLLEMARDLAPRLQIERPVDVFDDDEPPIEVREVEVGSMADVGDAFRLDGPVQQPVGSRCIVDRRSGGLTITVPPAGVLRGSKGLFPFGVLWLLITGGICGFMIVASWRGGGFLQAIAPLGFGAVFGAVGVALLIAGLNMGRRRAILDVVGDTLLVTRQSIFGMKQHEWTRAQLDEVAVRPSGMQVNDRDVTCLKITPGKGTAVKMLAQLPDDELAWIVAELRAALGF